MAETHAQQQRVNLLDRSINGSLNGKQVLTGSGSRVAASIVVCNACGHLGGTLERYDVEGKSLYFHPHHAPRQLVASKRATKLALSGAA